MEIRRILQSLAALVVGATVVVAAPLPGGATTGTVSSGTLTVSFPTTLTADLDPAGGPCPGMSMITLDLVSTTLTFVDLPFTYGGATYFLALNDPTQVLLSAGTMTVGPVNGMVMDIYPEVSPGSCAPDLSAPMCLSAGFPSGPNGLSVSGPWNGSNADLSGSRNVTALGCAAPFTGMGGRTLTITNMIVDF